MKYLIISDSARAGKDTIAEMLGLSYISSSYKAAELFILDHFNGDPGLPSYDSVEECHKDRVNYRELWHDLIADYNKSNPARLAGEIYKTNDVYVGMRSIVELLATMRLYRPIVIYVDARARVGVEGDSNKLNREICLAASDIVIDNNAGLEQLKEEVKQVKKLWKI